MEEIMAYLGEKIYLLLLIIIEGIGLFVWKEKNPEKWKKWKQKRIARLKKLRAKHLEKAAKENAEAEELEKELEKNA